MSDKTILSSDMQLTQQTLPIIEQIADLMPGGFFIYKADDKQEIIFANESLLDIFGCASKADFEELTGNTFKGMVHPDDLDEVEASILSQIATSRRNNDYVEYRIIRRDGSIRYVDDYGHFAHTEDFGTTRPTRCLRRSLKKRAISTRQKERSFSTSLMIYARR